MTELLLRFLIGGIVVSAFALIGDVFKPKSFGGMFGAAPSVALATLALTIRKESPEYAAVEARSMVMGAVALLLYSQMVCWLLLRRRVPPLKATLIGLPAWFVGAFGLWFCFLR